MSTKIFLGIDISKFSFDVSLLLPTNAKINIKKFFNNKSSFKCLGKWLKDNNVNIEYIHAWAITEFWIMHKYKRQGVGIKLAHKLWKQHKGY